MHSLTAKIIAGLVAFSSGILINEADNSLDAVHSNDAGAIDT